MGPLGTEPQSQPSPKQQMCNSQAMPDKRIAILGWGSLIWEKRPEFDRWRKPGTWYQAGPVLSLEFSRVSESRDGALTLVIDERGSPVRVAWCYSTRLRIEDAVCDLRCREGTNLANISCFQPDLDKDETSYPESIVDWARLKKLDAVVWTALGSNFGDEDKGGEPFSVQAALDYVKELPVVGKAKAAEYVWRAPEFVQTELRTKLQAEPWFNQIEND